RRTKKRQFKQNHCFGQESDKPDCPCTWRPRRPASAHRRLRFRERNSCNLDSREKPAFAASRLSGGLHGRGLIDLVDGALKPRVKFGVAHPAPEGPREGAAEA